MNQLLLLVFNVGQGLSVALVERPENYVTLIDLGASTGFTPLKYLGLKHGLRPDVLLVTHPHADHIADVETALDPTFRPLAMSYQTYNWADVRKREKPALAYKVDLFQDLIKAVPRAAYAGAARLQDWCFTPDNARASFGDASYVNNSSLFIVYEWRDFRISIAGDLESDAMAALVASPTVEASAGHTDILIPPHHGHKNGFPTEWVSRMGKPSVSVISVQERDPSVDTRYRSAEFAKGVSFGGETRYALTTRADGNIVATMGYDQYNRPTWTFSSF